VGLPLLAIAAITGFSDVSSKGRRFLAAISAPLLLVIGSFFYYSVLPYAAYSTHWLNHKDVIRATNGPAEYFYRYVVEQGTPLLFEEFALEVGLENLPAKERLRAHVATLYLGNKQFAYYLYKEYPYYYEKKQR
jgi:hypothetical protein